MTGRSAAGPCGGGGVCQRHLAARVAARDSPAGDGGRTDDVELLILQDQGNTVVFAGKGSTHQSCIQLKQGGTLPLARKGKLHYLQVAFPQMDKAMTSVTSKEMHNQT